MKLNELTITDASKKLASGEITSVQLTQACLDAIAARNTELNAYLEVFDDALAQAAAADARRKAGENHPLLGTPLAIKDNILIEGRRASAASKMLENYVATYDATVIKKLKEAGAVFLGRTNMDEFAMGGSNENSAFGAVKNPHDSSRVPGGSSGGSAAAVAAHLCLGALGTDTGGSVREPAAFCGVVGMKPTYGGISRSGIMAMAASLNQCGVLAKTAEDAELLFNTIAGLDALDSQTFDAGVYPKRAAQKKIGVPRALLAQGIDADVLERFEASLKKFQSQGYTLVDVDIPSAPLALAAYYIIMPAEASTDLARYDGVRYGLSLKAGDLVGDYAATRGAGFGQEVRRRIMLGTYVLSSGYYDAYYAKALAARAQLRAEYAKALTGVDVIAMPTTTSPAPKLGEKSEPLAMYLLDIFTVTANITGNPALSVPMGTVEREGKQLPVGLQFTAAHGDETGLFAAAKSL
ncbi:MAG: Asp-tRNA(Asn)/Glu-tRNA(Gln) amidotransferase subunit GatA [Patescibacteria group bacterium]|nr:Asp-tRNA(Asn)/Glu-tRNA(Gln) amidotransferase subunit GatA [Patescibacteria group bacterium]